MVRVEMSSLFHIEYFSLPKFDLVDEIYCLKTLTAYSRLESKMLLGFENGSLYLDTLKHVNAKDSFNRSPSKLALCLIYIYIYICFSLKNKNVRNVRIKKGDAEIDTVLHRKHKVEHKQRIEIVDSCKRFKIFASCRYLLLWTVQFYFKSYYYFTFLWKKFSLDGFIKLWDAEKNLIAELKLDDTLSYCRFCNSYGDLICGWRNHIFKIVLKRGKVTYLITHLVNIWI